MGYSTEFEGQFNLDKPLRPEYAEYLRKFSETRRMRRDVSKVEKLDDPVRRAVGLPIGYEGGYFVGGKGFCGQDDDVSVVDHNYPPASQPGLWCGWIPNDDSTAIEWNGVEKFYHYTTWLEYLIVNFLEPWGYKLNGEVKWVGEDPKDLGKIVVKDNKITKVTDKIKYTENIDQAREILSGINWSDISPETIAGIMELIERGSV